MGVALWSTNSLRTAAIRAQEKPLPPVPGALDLTLAVPQQQEASPLLPSPSQLPQGLGVKPVPTPSRLPQVLPVSPTPSPTPLPRELPGEPGEADRLLPENPPLPHLHLPIAGLDVHSLHDSFSEHRDGRLHEALDIPAPRGTPVVAATQGNVVKLFNSKRGGLTVYQFDDSQTYCYYYAHLDRYATGLHEGVLLRPGEVLGYVGTTGDAAGGAPHLHFAVFRLDAKKKWWQGTALDPLPLLAGSQENRTQPHK
jgi:murein DD-endopeptidase MepM/ murein hydrolase activator NlpD